MSTTDWQAVHRSSIRFTTGAGSVMTLTVHDRQRQESSRAIGSAVRAEACKLTLALRLGEYLLRDLFSRLSFGYYSQLPCGNHQSLVASRSLRGLGGSRDHSTAR